jgi:hypothetical protein
MREAKIEETETGHQPADDGWWILNVRDIGRALALAASRLGRRGRSFAITPPQA